MTLDNVLKRNYQRISTNRFIVDSPRFWRREFHPRFREIFEYSEFQEIVNAVNEHLSFQFSPQFMEGVSMYLFEWFSEYRFANIPAKAPNSPSQFLSEMYFCLLDVFPQIQFSDFPLIDDDFNLVGHRAETGKQDTSKVATAEHSKQDAKHATELDILSKGELRQTSSASTENVDDETNQNTKQNNDVYLSPQNQGVTPNNVSEKGKGVDGVTLNPSAGFTTNTQNTIMGDTVIGKTNTSAQAQQAEQGLTQDNDTRTAHETGSELGMEQEQENATQKHDVYTEQLDFNRSARLQEYYNLGKDRLWLEILSRLSRWILQIDIATGDRNYNDCPMYE